MNQSQFAESLHLSQNVICLIENGVIEPSERTIHDICNVYCINEYWLKNGCGDVFPVQALEQSIDFIKNTLRKDGDATIRRYLIELLCKMDIEQLEQYKKLIIEIAKKYI